MKAKRVRVVFMCDADALQELQDWLTKTGRDAYGALSAELRTMVREGLDRRQRELTGRRRR